MDGVRKQDMIQDFIGSLTLLLFDNYSSSYGRIISHWRSKAGLPFHFPSCLFAKSLIKCQQYVSTLLASKVLKWRETTVPSRAQWKYVSQKTQREGLLNWPGFIRTWCQTGNNKVPTAHNHPTFLSSDEVREAWEESPFKAPGCFWWFV